MKIKNLAIIILMTTFFIILSTKVYATTGIINDKTVKLRKSPDSKTVLDYVYKGDEVEILEEEDGWYKVKATTELGKVTGYISENEIDMENSNANKKEEPSETKKDVEDNTTSEIPVETPTEIIETNETISTDVEVEKTNTNVSNTIEEGNQYTISQEVGVKALPLIYSREKAKINGNVKVVEIINDWARIENDTEDGWIRKNILKQSLVQMENSIPEQETQQQPKEEQQPQEQPEVEPEEKVPEQTTTQQPEKVPETTEINKKGYVSAEGLKVRKEPTTDSDEVDSLSKNDEVKIIGQTGKWYKIDLDGKIGYVSSKYISDTKVPETTSRSGSTLKDENVLTEEESTKQEEPKVEEVPTVSAEAEKTTQPETSTTRTTGAEVVEYAKKYLGYKYVSGGASPSTGFDCSGFTSYVYKNFGVSLNRTSGAQINNGVAVSKENLQPGDLVIFNNDANTKIGHVGIYVGDGNFIHASNPSDGVKITTLKSGYYHKRYVGARRVV